MSFFSDLRVLYHMAVKPVRGKSHQQRLESFYSGQAEDYDQFRKRLLKGREELWQTLGVPEGGIWVDMGGGTGSNLEYFGDEIAKLRQVYVVDLATSLLEVCRQRAAERGWDHVEAVEADATTWTPPEGSADVITFSYSLTMIPDWFSAIDNALRILKPGGRIGVADFFVARKYPARGHEEHSWFARSFWPVWFASDNVFPSPDHVPYLHARFEVEHFSEHFAQVPYLFWMSTPYYNFVGRKPLEANGTESS